MNMSAPQADKMMSEVIPDLRMPARVVYLLTSLVENEADSEDICSFWKGAIDTYCWERGVYQFKMTEIYEQFKMNIVEDGRLRLVEPLNLRCDDVLRAVLNSHSGNLIKKSSLEHVLGAVSSSTSLSSSSSSGGIFGAVYSLLSSPLSHVPAAHTQGSVDSGITDSIIAIGDSDCDTLLSRPVLKALQQLILQFAASSASYDIDNVMYAFAPRIASKSHIAAAAAKDLSFPAYILRASEYFNNTKTNTNESQKQSQSPQGISVSLNSGNNSNSNSGGGNREATKAMQILYQCSTHVEYLHNLSEVLILFMLNSGGASVFNHNHNHNHNHNSLSIYTSNTSTSTSTPSAAGGSDNKNRVERGDLASVEGLYGLVIKILSTSTVKEYEKEKDDEGRRDSSSSSSMGIFSLLTSPMRTTPQKDKGSSSSSSSRNGVTIEEVLTLQMKIDKIEREDTIAEYVRACVSDSLIFDFIFSLNFFDFDL